MFQSLPIMENDWKPVNWVKEKSLKTKKLVSISKGHMYTYTSFNQISHD